MANVAETAHDSTNEPRQREALSTIQDFMENWAPRFFTNASVALELMHFCIWNQSFLLDASFGREREENFFERYFPELLKTFLWHPHALSAELEELLPLMLSPKSFKEVLHALLDLPLQVCVLEGSLFSGERSVEEMEQGRVFEGLTSSIDGSDGSVGDAPRKGSLRETFVSFFWRSRSMVLGKRSSSSSSSSSSYSSSSSSSSRDRDEARAFDGSLWSSRLLRMTAINFASSAPVHVRACVVCDKTPALLGTALDVISTDAGEEIVIDALRVVLSRFPLLFGPAVFANQTRRVIMDWMRDVVVCMPRSMLSVRDIVFSVLARASPFARRSRSGLELVLHLVVMIGEHIGGKGEGGAADQAEEDTLALVSEKELVKYYLVVEDVCARARDQVQARGAVGFGMVGRILSAAVAVVAKLAARCVRVKHRAQRFLLVVATQPGLPDAIAEEATEGARFLHLYGAAKRLA